MNMTDAENKLLGHLRTTLTEVDGRILELVAERQRLVEEIGRSKQVKGQATRDFAREKDVIEGAVDRARGLGIPSDTVEALMRLLIRSSLTTQERDRVSSEGRGSGRRALVIGGAGQMGRWFVEFLASQGYDVEIADPAAEAGREGARRDWDDGPLDQDLIVVAAPLVRSGQILETLAQRRPPGLIFDVGSLKSPLRHGLAALAEAGCRVTSVHPMFGPDTRLLSGRHVIFADVGHAGATAEARALFESTMAEQVEMSLEEHDRLIAFVLGLSHALNIAFFTALAESGTEVPLLSRLSSTTFDAQLEVCRKVARENPWLYFEIQSLNEHGPAALSALARSVERIRDAINAGDADAFVQLMEQGRDYLASRRPPEGV
jgi:chorismate mutase/prephenate dehydrogenase